MQEKEQILFEDKSSPTAKLESFTMIAAIAATGMTAARNWNTAVMDIGGAYLNADISSHNVVMRIDQQLVKYFVDARPDWKGVVRSNGSVLVKLSKALYGCIQSAKLWFDLLSSTLVSLGYVKHSLDECVFSKRVDDHICYLVVYVDDLFVCSDTPDLINELKEALVREFKELSVKEGKVLPYLGMELNFSVPGQLSLSQTGYVNDFIREYGVEGTASTPATRDFFDQLDGDPLPPDLSTTFHSRIAKLLYLAKRTRPDILLPVVYLSTKVTSPTTVHWGQLERILKYINGSKELGIKIRVDLPIKLSAYIDASYGVHKDAKSHSGLVISLGSGPIMVKSAKQKVVSKSSTEAELIAASDMCSQVLWNRNFLIHLGEDVPPAIVYQDNKSAILLEKNASGSSERTRHIKIRDFWIKDRIDEGEMVVEYLATEDMIADLLTKPLQGALFLKLRSLLLNWF
jgi:hypothetical protein